MLTDCHDTIIVSHMKTGDTVMLLAPNYTTDLSAPAKAWVQGTVISVRRGRVVVETILGRCQVKLGATCLRAA